MAKKEYTLKTIEDISKVVTDKNFKNLMLDLASVFADFLLIKKKTPEVKLKFILWTDDNKIGMKGVNFMNKKGKIIKKFKLPNR